MVSRPPFGLAALGAFVLTLSACGGGGGGSGTVPTTASDYTATTTTTTSTSTVAPIVYCCDPAAAAPTTLTETLQLNGGVSNGFAITTNVTGDHNGPTAVTGGGTSANPASVTVNPSGPVETVTIATVNPTAWSNTVTYGSPGTTQLDFLDSHGLMQWVNWTETSPSDIKVATAYLYSFAPTYTTWTLTPEYQYMAWGWWLTSEYLSTDTTVNGIEGYLVVGKPTEPGNIPTTGSATYTGETFGQALDGTVYGTFNATADFQNRRIDVSSTNSMLDSTAGSGAAPQYDFSGTLSYAAGVNQFSGAISNSTMTGTATGMFYGPAAEEIGGVFEIANGTAAVKGVFLAN